MSQHQDAGQNIENMAKFKYLWTKVTSKNWIHKQIKNILNSWNVCYHLIQKLFLPSPM